ncbi:PIN domain-containing protein [Zychaea mexicana]|uniref:PIN domain-containing protein n=1 Tax=Zychaea mexicana TaxID=64656 RepID=UPI0022FE71EF|nr:PIN domain-containing protein [Zychaea mexicana]KAI9495232.1 PIN domain-containing protein [Zychaea mexicana]
MTDENFFMDVDGPEFINEVNNEIHNYRCAEGFHPTELTQDWAAQYDGQIENDRLGMEVDDLKSLQNPGATSGSSIYNGGSSSSLDHQQAQCQVVPGSTRLSTGSTLSTTSTVFTTSTSTSFTSSSSSSSSSSENHNYASLTTPIASSNTTTTTTAASSGSTSSSFSSHAILSNCLTQTSVFNCQQIAVLDTNFLISNLGYLTALATQAEKYLGSLVVVVPWVVVTELDGLKGRNNIQSHKHGSSGKLGDLARRAMKFVQIALADQRGWLRGQKMDEVFEQEAKMLKGDDSILDCCRYFAQLRKPITLFTNDRNLAIKAMIHQVQTLSAESREKLIDYASSLSSHIPSVQQQQQQRQHQPHQQYIDEDVEMMDESDDIDVAQQQLQQQIVQDKQEIRAIVQNPGYSERNFNIWTSKHAPANYSPPSTANPSNSNNNNNNSHRRSSHINSNNYSWTDDAPVLDRNGEPLIPPSSSAGRLEEVRRRKQQQKRRN